MIVLPNTPPFPKPVALAAGKLSSQLTTKRNSLLISSTSYNELTRYVVAIEEYLDELFEFGYEKAGSDLAAILKFASQYVITTSAEPWSIVLKESSSSSILDKKLDFKRRSSSSSVPHTSSSSPQKAPSSSSSSSSSSTSWTLFTEIELSILSASLAYTSIGSQVINELIEETQSNEEVISKWKQVVNFFKKAISFISFGSQINELSSSLPIATKKVDGVLYHFIEKLNNVNIQMSILSKSSWINRQEYSYSETIKTSNNSTLARVAVYVVDELANCQSILSQLKRSNKSEESITLNYKYWQEYLSVIEKYATATCGLFLSIEHYQQDKLGEAIGLVNFSLLKLQKKKVDDKSSGDGNSKLPPFKRLKEKFQNKRNESYINNLQSITSLSIDKSAFQESSGIILKDLSYVFDQLVLLHLKYSKENDNLKFDKVASWAEINADSKWPLGSQIPVSAIEKYQPRCFINYENSGERGTATRSQYF